MTDYQCERCEKPCDIDTDALRVTGEKVCEDCADEALADHGQFGVGA